MLTILGIIQGVSSALLICFYINTRFNIVTKGKWREFTKSNKNLTVLPNPDRLSVDEMSIEQTHLILLVNGPDAIEFNIVKG
jgi:hypothetical protein